MYRLLPSGPAPRRVTSTSMNWPGSIRCGEGKLNPVLLRSFVNNGHESRPTMPPTTFRRRGNQALNRGWRLRSDVEVISHRPVANRGVWTHKHRDYLEAAFSCSAPQLLHDNVLNSIVRFFQEISKRSFKTSQYKKYLYACLSKMAHFLHLPPENQNFRRDRNARGRGMKPKPKVFHIEQIRLRRFNSICAEKGNGTCTFLIFWLPKSFDSISSYEIRRVASGQKWG
jgi:hypothetical protein